jgi:hypothetical protein
VRDTDEVRFLKILNGLGALKKIDLNPAAIDLWWGAFADWSIEDFDAAAKRLILEKQWIGPNDFQDLRKAGRPTPGEAWEKAVAWAASGQWRGGPMGDDLVDRCVRIIGGYQAIAMCDTDRLHFIERRFCGHFGDIEDRQEIREAVPAIAYADRRLEQKK